jgi:hypothetical protein
LISRGEREREGAARASERAGERKGQQSRLERESGDREKIGFGAAFFAAAG